MPGAARRCEQISGINMQCEQRLIERIRNRVDHVGTIRQDTWRDDGGLPLFSEPRSVALEELIVFLPAADADDRPKIMVVRGGAKPGL